MSNLYKSSGVSAQVPELEELLGIVYHLEERVGQQKYQAHHHHDDQQDEDHALQVVLLLDPVDQL
jgi:hypothetical protein